MENRLTAEDIFPAIESLINQLGNPIEKNKIETMILGIVESFERRKNRISLELDKVEKYQIKLSVKKNGNKRKKI